MPSDGDYYFYLIILIPVFIILIYYLIYEKNNNDNKVEILPNGVNVYPNGRKTYEAHFVFDHKYYVPDEILNDHTIQVIYLE